MSNIEDKVISMCAKGMSTRDITSHIEEIYGIPLSAPSISKMTDKIIPVIEQWQNRTLDNRYPFIFMDVSSRVAAKWTQRVRSWYCY